MGSTTTMRLIFALLALGMLLGVSGQASMFDDYWYNEFHGQGYGLRALIPTGIMLSVFLTVAIQSAIESIRHSLSSILNPIQKPFAIDTSNAEDSQSKALVLYQPFLATGAVVPAAAAALVPESNHGRALVTANVTGGSTGAPTMIPIDTLVDTSNIDDSLCNGFAVVPYRPFLAIGAVEPAATAALVSASNYFRALVIVAGGGIGIPTTTQDTAVIATTVNVDFYGNRAVVVYRPIDLVATAVPATTGVRITFAYVLRSTSVTGGGDDALAIAIISMETMSADQCLALILYHPYMVVTILTPAITAAEDTGIHGYMSSFPADTAPHAPTDRPSPPGSKTRPQADWGGNSAPVVEVSAGFDDGVDTSTPVVEVPTVFDDGADEIKTIVAPVIKVSGGFDDGVGTSTPVVEVPTVFDDGADEVKTLVAPVTKDSSPKDSSQESPQSLAVSVLPVGVHTLSLAVLPANVQSLLLALNTLNTTVSDFLWDSWSTLRKSIGSITRQGEEEHVATPNSLPPLESCFVPAGRGFPCLTPADVWTALRGLTSWCLLSPVESTIRKALSSSASFIWSSTLGQGVLFIVTEVSSRGWGCFGLSAFDAFIASLVARGDLVISAMYLSFLLILGAGWIVGGTASLVGYFSILNDGKRPGRDGRARSPRGRRRGKRGGATKTDEVARGSRPPGRATGVSAKAWRSRGINGRRLKCKGL